MLLPWLVWTLVLVGLGLLLAWLGSLERAWRAKERFHGVELRPRPLLVNASERAAWDLLQKTDLGQAHLFAKVRLEDVVSVRAQTPAARKAVRGYIKARHLDFVLTDEALSPLMVVEVDGGSHAHPGAAHGDEVKEQVLAAAGVVLVRLRVGSGWRQRLELWGREKARAASTDDARAPRAGEGGAHAAERRPEHR